MPSLAKKIHIAPTQRFFQKSQEVRTLTDGSLRRIFAIERAIVKKHHSPALRQGFQLLQEFTMRKSSKRLRALLVFLGYESSGKKAPKKLAQIAAVIEIVHNYLLILDDIVDRDEFRRGGLTVHEAYRRSLPGSASERQHRGTSMAILLGSYASLMAFRHFMNASWPAQRRHEAITHLLTRLQHETFVGEFMDVEQTWLQEMRSQTVREVAELKTSSYTFALPLHIGAILAGANQRQRKALTAFAMPVGVGFQLADDLLGYAPTKKSGKSANDLREGKITEIILTARTKLGRAKRRRLDLLLQKPVRTARDIHEMRLLIASTDALSSVQAKAIAFAEAGKIRIQQNRHVASGCATMLAMLADLCVQRET